MKKSLLLVPAVVLLAGCETVSWLQPVYTPSDIAVEPALTGVWRESEGDTVTISVEGEKYRFLIEDRKGEKTALSGYLLRINGELYADLVEEGPGIPSHLLVRIDLVADSMTWFTLRDSWLRSAVKDGTLPSTRIAEGRKDTRWVVNVPPEEAQRLLRSYRYQAWEETVRLERIP